MDSVGRIVSSMQVTAQQLQWQIPTVAAVKDIIGISLDQAAARLFGPLTDAQYEQFMTVYRQQYVTDDPTPTPLFDGVRELLQQLHQQGYTLAVATGKARHGLERVWSEVQLQDLFHASRCADETDSKPNPQMLLELLDETGFHVTEAVMVGDSIHDMQMAQSIQMARIGVSFGAHEPQRLQQFAPLTVVDHIAQLTDYI